MSQNSKMDVSQCLRKLGISADKLSGCGGDVKQEWTVIKKVCDVHDVCYGMCVVLHVA